METEILKQFFTIVHILGAVIGAGGAFISDIIFLKSIEDKNIDKIEFSFLNLLSKVVWFGLIVLLISGIGLFALDAEKFIESSKFLAKMTILTIILINGIVFHFLHIPYIKRSFHRKLFDYSSRHQGVILVLSGAVSLVSWFSALVLGTMRGLTLSYAEILSIYVCLLIFAMIGSVFTLRKMLKQEDVIFAKKIISLLFFLFLIFYCFLFLF